MNSFKNIDGGIIVYDMIAVIQNNKEYLSEVDGAIGDGDHGINMNKGFTLCKARLDEGSFGFAESLDMLGNVLFTEIGGSMGPLYGTLFMDMASAVEDKEIINAEDFGTMLTNAVDGLHEIVQAQVGDKTLIDTLIPSRDAFILSVSEGKSFSEALEVMKKAAEDGKNYTKDLVAKFGRSSRLGERSRGVLDAGATSCCLLLQQMADSIIKLLQK